MIKHVLAAALAAVGLTTSSFGAVNVIEGFENSSDPASWQATAMPDQTLNATNPPVSPLFTAANATEGVQSGEFTTVWSLPGVSGGANVYEAGGPLMYWSIRYNVNAPGALTGNSILNADGILEADFLNNNPYPIQVALVVDSISSSQLERGPLVSIAPNTTATYTWNFATLPPVGFVTGDGILGGTTSRLKSLLVYTPVQPTSANMSLFVDNIRNSNAQIDLSSPASPIVYQATQGALTGNLEVSWKTNTEPDLGGYRIYLASDANFGTPATNRLTFPASPVTTAPAGVNSVTLSSIPAGQNVYVAVTAFDTAFPTPNESPAGSALGASLRSDGSTPDNRVVLDLNRYAPGTPEFVNNGYAHAVVYTGQALQGLNLSYDSATAAAIDDAAVALVPNSAGAVIWSNMLDGVDGGSIGSTQPALTNASAAALTAFNGAGGNLLLSGAGVAEDLIARGAVTTTFLSNVLRSVLESPNAAVSQITGQVPLASAGTFSTSQNVIMNTVGFSTSSNEVLSSGQDASIAAIYSGIPGTTGGAAIVHTNAVVFLGFGFESAGSPGGSAASKTVRQNLMQSALNYLINLAAVKSWQLYDSGQ